MLISSQNLRGVYVGFNTLFNKAFEAQKPQFEQIATVTPSTTESETYAWLGDIPGMREWIGDRDIQNLIGSDYTIKNKDFEATVGVPRNAIEDDKIGLYNPSIQMLGQSAAMHPDTLIFKLLGEGFDTKCYDGKTFFATDHPVGKKSVSNKGTAKLSLDSYIVGRANVMSRLNSKGISLGFIPDVLAVAPSNEAIARQICLADFINGTKNTMQGTATPLVVPELSAHPDAWFLLCTNKPIKPLIYQQRQKAKFVSVTNETDESVFMRKTYLYGVDSRGNAGFALWQMAYGSDGSTAE